jgi:proline dehydrogenase
MSNRTSGQTLADNIKVRNFFEKQGTKNSLVHRFIAGVTLRDAFLVAKEYRDERYLCAFDLLGENVLGPEDAEKSVQAYLELIRQMSIFSVDSYLSLKLSSLGLDISVELARENLHRLTEEARTRGEIFIQVEAEGSAVIGKILQIVADEHRLYSHLGTVAQAYLRRTDKDLSLLIKEKIPIRLTEGSLSEPPIAAFQSKSDIDVAFRKHMYFLLEHGLHPAIGTHDPELINVAKKFIKQHNIPADSYEFEMLYGVKRDLQQQLLKEGHAVRVYLPFGMSWYPHFSRRLAASGFSLGTLFGK